MLVYIEDDRMLIGTADVVIDYDMPVYRVPRRQADRPLPKVPPRYVQHADPTATSLVEFRVEGTIVTPGRLGRVLIAKSLQDAEHLPGWRPR